MRSLLLIALVSILSFDLQYALVFSNQQNPNLAPTKFLETFNTNKNDTNPIVRMHSLEGSFFCTATVVDIYHAITAAHCVTEFVGSITQSAIDIRSIDGTHITYANAEGLDAYKDSAILRGDFRSVRSAAVDMTGRIKIPIGAMVKACGFPAGQYELYCVDLEVTGNIGFQIRTKGSPILKGMSGGPVIYNNSIVAVNSAVTKDSVVLGTIVGLQVMAVQ